MNVEKISAVTLRIVNMRDSVRFYRDVLGMETIYGGEAPSFSTAMGMCSPLYSFSKRLQHLSGAGRSLRISLQPWFRQS